MAKKKEQVLAFVNTYQEERGYCPTGREIAEALGISSGYASLFRKQLIEEKQFIPLPTIRETYKAQVDEKINRVLAFINAYQDEHGYCPTGYEIADATGLSYCQATSYRQKLTEEKQLNRLPTMRERNRDRGGGLTQRQMEVLTHLAQGSTIRSMAYHMGCSQRTVMAHIRFMKEKLGAVSSSNAVHIAHQRGLLG